MLPDRWLITYSKRYPGAWKQYDEFRADRVAFGNWPEWCFCPLAASYAVISGGGANRVPFGRIQDVGALGALAAWRPAKGVYEFHECLEDALWETPVSGNLPSDLFLRLPEWCPYVILQNPRLGMVGFWVHLEHDSKDLRTELRYVLDLGETIFPIPLHIGGGATVDEALSRALNEGAWQAKLQMPGLQMMPREVESGKYLRYLEGALSLTLYLCTKNAEIRPGNAPAEKAGAPGNPAPTKTRDGPRLYPPDRPRVWECGWRIGPELAAAFAREKGDGLNSHAGPRPHLRRAHWHTYRVGAGREKTALKWLHPILVGGADETVATVRGVE